MSISSIGVLLPLIVFGMWFWAIHTSKGAFKYAKSIERKSNLNPEVDNASESKIVEFSWRDSFLRAAVLWGVYLSLSSEILSLVRMLSRTGILIAWGAALGMTLFFLGRIGLVSVLPALRKNLRLLLGMRLRFRFSLTTLLVLLLTAYISITLIVALNAPPNTNDSLQYHMTRVMHWFQNRSLEHYATPSDRQIWMPIWAETAILHFFALFGSDRLSNLVQWFSMVTSLIGVSLLAAWMGATRWGQLLTALFAVTIPMGVLQSTSTQTDYVSACWAVCLAYFTVRILRSKQFAYSDLLWAGFTAGLGILTKGTFLVYSLPFLAGLGIFLWFKRGNGVFLKSLFLGATVVFIINAGAWARNFKTYQTPLGPTSNLRSLSNEIFGVGPLLSNLVKDVTLHIGTPYGVVNGPIYDSVAWFHRVIHQDLNDPRTSLGEYWVKRSKHEDYAGNPWHFLSIFPALALLLSPTVLRIWQLIDRDYQLALSMVWFRRRQVLNYTGSALMTFVLFALLFKWQRSGSRLQLPFFVLWSPVFGIALETLGKSRLARITSSMIVLFFTLSSTSVLIANPSRQLFSVQTWTSPLFEKTYVDLLFMNFPEIKPAYLDLAEAVKAQQCNSIGLMLDSSDAEYPFWALLSPSGTEIHFENLFSIPELSRYIRKDYKVCAIICSICIPQTLENMKVSESAGGFYLYIPDQSHTTP